MKILLSLILSSLYLVASTAFITPQELKNKINSKNLVLIDTTDLETFSKEHILNAVQIGISGFRHPVTSYQLMNSSQDIQKIARSLGINNDSSIVIYGHGNPKELLKASYMALAFITNGLNNVSILDGGFPEFSYEYEELISTKTITPKEGNFVAAFNPNVLVDIEYIREHIGKTPMIEARPLRYFNGSTQSKGVKRLGHITKAQSSFWKDKFNSDETLKSNEELNEIFFKKHKLQIDKEVIAYCTGGLEASMNWYILSQYLNFKNVKIYDASMRQWGNLDDTPMQK